MHANVAAVLTNSKVNWVLHFHKNYGEIKSPVDFAAALNVDIGRISKTLFLRMTPQTGFALIVCSISRRIHIANVSKALNCARVELAKPEELAHLIHYPPKGVSPLGVEGLPVLMDESLLIYPSIWIGAGSTGEEIEINPQDLALISNAITGSFCE
ncbi:MAG: YbaK/EbsC family protein [Anaerolineae bacterium]|nr:YbaK/EbsC family protein [Anaerolineae bacterium]